MIRPDFRDFMTHDQGIMHYGIPRRSGRYPWGSGKNPFQGIGKTISNTFSDLKNSFILGIEKVGDKIAGKQGTDKYVDRDGKYEKKSELKRKSSNPDDNKYVGFTEIQTDCLIVNDKGDTLKEGRNMNCMYCTCAMAMRSKGYDVLARSTDYGPENEDEFMQEYFSGTIPINISSEKNIDEEELLELIEEYIDDLEDGSYGALMFKWSDGLSGHSVFYKIEDGKMIIYDGQLAKESPIKEYISNDNIKKSTFKFFRLDNVEPSQDIGKVVVSKK